MRDSGINPGAVPQKALETLYIRVAANGFAAYRPSKKVSLVGEVDLVLEHCRAKDCAGRSA